MSNAKWCHDEDVSFLHSLPTVWGPSKKTKGKSTILWHKMWCIKGGQLEVRTTSRICHCSGKLNTLKSIFDHYDLAYYLEISEISEKWSIGLKLLPDLFFQLLSTAKAFLFHYLIRCPACGNIYHWLKVAMHPLLHTTVHHWQAKTNIHIILGFLFCFVFLKGTKQTKTALG